MRVQQAECRNCQWRRGWLGATLGLVCLIFAGADAATAADPATRVRESIDAHWRFHRGEAAGAEVPGHDDDGWRVVNLPHDWSVEPDKASQGPKSENIFNPDSPSHAGGGYLTGGVGWYRREFWLPVSPSDRRVSVEFEGVYMDSDVWVNGHHLGRRPYGYSSFVYDLTPYVHRGDPNVLAVRVNAPMPSSRWYSGAGIYRHVWLTQTDPVHVAHWGTFVTTPEVTADKARTNVKTEVVNEKNTPAGVGVRMSVIDPDGTKVSLPELKVAIPPGDAFTFSQSFDTPKPQLWSTESPKLYTVVCDVAVDGAVVDTQSTPYGIRTFEFTKDRGFLLNGKRVPIQGVCQHHDQGVLGAAAYDRAIERQLEILKLAGCNAVRTSHNPPAPELLELCDKMGFLVMDEAFDCWNVAKSRFDYGRFFVEWHDRDLADLVRRDRNHPSVILWSIGNEIPNIGSTEGAAWTRRLSAIVHREDPTRPTIAACNGPDGTAKAGSADALGVFGINYSLGRFDAFRDKYLLVSSESSSTVSSRGEYAFEPHGDKTAIVSAHKNQVSGYDVFVPDWADHAEHMLLKLKESPWIAGEFVWTGFDYIGEPTPFYWPSNVSYFGFIDLCGFPKDRFYLYQSVWTEKPMVHLLPHWNWEGAKVATIPVWAYSNADEVELYLNGKSMGARTTKDAPDPDVIAGQSEGTFTKNKYLRPGGHAPHPLHFAWDVPWQPGTLKAVARKGGKEVAVDEVRTAGKPARVELSVDRPRIAVGRQDLAYVTAKVVDEHGIVCPEADATLTFDVSGPAEIAGVGNGDATSHEDFQADHRKAYHGLALIVLRSGSDPGSVTLHARGEGLAAGSVAVEVVGR